MSASALCKIVCLIGYVSLTIGQFTGDADHASSRTRQRQLDRDRYGPNGHRCCPDCMVGPECSHNVKMRDPKFHTPMKIVTVTGAHHNGRTHLAYNSTTYPGVPACPCSAFEYRISDIEGSNGEITGDLESLFRIDSATGHVFLNDDVTMRPNQMYVLTILVRNVLTNASDETRLSVNSLSPVHQFTPLRSHIGNDVGSNIEDIVPLEPQPLSRHKRATPPTETQFTLSYEPTAITEIRVGTRIKFKLDIVFPATPVDMRVELFTPDDTHTIMILCDVSVTFGSNLHSTYNNSPVFESKTNQPHQIDWAILDFGLVNYTTSNPSTLADHTATVLYEAVMTDSSQATNSTYWVSAGAEYSSETFIWIGQASFTAMMDGNMTVGSDPIFNVTLPTSLALGQTVLGTLDMYIPYPAKDYVLKVHTPADEIGLMSICWIQNTWTETDFGSNFRCGNKYSQITSGLTKDAQAIGNSIATVNLGTLLNKGSRDANPVVSENRISAQFIAHLYPDVTKVGQLRSLGFSLEAGNTTVIVGTANFTITAAGSSSTNPGLTSVTPSGPIIDAMVGKPVKVTYVMSIPPSTSASLYVIEASVPANAFTVCSLKVTSIGNAMPCHNPHWYVSKYETTAGNVEPDKASVDLGYVTNLNLTTNNLFTVEAVFKPLSGATLNTLYTLNFNVTVGTTPVNIHAKQITVTSSGSPTTITNATAPMFNMDFYNGNIQVPVNGGTRVDVTMTTSRNVTYDAFDMEFITPFGNTSTYMHVCRVDIVRNGKNVPCISPEWYNTRMDYRSQYNDGYNDRALLNLGSLCNMEDVNNNTEDQVNFAFFYRVLDNVEVTHNSEHHVSMGLQYSSTQLFVGDIQMTATRGQNFGPTGDSFGAYFTNSSYNPLPIGVSLLTTIVIKIPRGNSSEITVKATSNNQEIQVCTVRVVAAGNHFPCVDDKLVKRTYVMSADGTGFSEVSAAVGIVTNYGDTSGQMTPNGYMDNDGFQVEVILRAARGYPSTTASYTVHVYLDTQKTSALAWSLPVTTTESFAAVPQTTAQGPVNASMSIGEMTIGDNNSTVAIGDVRMVTMDVVVPERSEYYLRVSFVVAVGDVGKIEICDGAVIFVGDNVPCVNNEVAPTFQGSSDYNSTVSFDLGYVCNKPLYPGNTGANTVRLAAYVRVVPNGLAVPGSTVSISGTVETFTSTVTVGTLTLTVADSSIFTDRVVSLPNVPNDTIMTLSVANPLVMNVGQNVTLDVIVKVPPVSVSRFLFDAEVPHDGTSACMTIRDIRVVGSLGRNVLCVEPSVNNKNVIYTPYYNSSLGNGQTTYGYLDVGIITNTGVTYKRKTPPNATTDDDRLLLQLDIQMADCATNVNGTLLTISLGHKIANYVFIYEHPVQVRRDTLEKPDIFLEGSVNAASNSSAVVLNFASYHSVNSSAEGLNTSYRLWFPAYLIPRTPLVSSNKSDCVIVPDSSVTSLVEIQCEHLYFSEVFHFSVGADVNTSAVTPVGYNTDPSVALLEVTTGYSSNLSDAYNLTAWYPEPTTFADSLEFSVTAGMANCNAALGLESGVIADCQISGSSNSIASPTLARLDGTSAWKPYVRNGKFAENRFWMVYFGDQTRVTSLDVQQNTVAPHKATEITMEYTNDGKSWFGSETKSLGPNPGPLTNVLTSGTVSRGLRIRVTNDTTSMKMPNVALKFELYGCEITSTVTQAAACAVVAATNPTVPADFYHRSFLTTSVGQVIVCDRKSDSSTYHGHCIRSLNNGDEWNEIDGNLASMIGRETALNVLYAYGQNLKTILQSTDEGLTWMTASPDRLAADKLLGTWIGAKNVPETSESNLITATPHFTFQQSPWGATYSGMFYNTVQKHKWSSA